MVCEQGFIETIADGQSARVPWFALTGDDATCDFGHVFTADDSKNTSMPYNMLGINAYLREGLESEPLPVPAAAIHANPEPLGTIAERIKQSRERFGARGKHAKDEAADRKLSAWLES